MDDQIPAPHLGSGLPRTFKMLELLCELGHVVTFVPLTIRTQHQPATRRLEQLGIEVFSRRRLPAGRPAARPRRALRRRGHQPAAQRRQVSRPGPRALSPRPDRLRRRGGVLREGVPAGRAGGPRSERGQKRGCSGRSWTSSRAPTSSSPCPSERDVVVRETGHDQVIVWGHARDVRAPETPFSKRRDLALRRGFLHGHPPNTDAVMRFAATCSRPSSSASRTAGS